MGCDVDNILSSVEPADVTTTSVPESNTFLHLAAKFGHVTHILPRLISTLSNLVYARGAKDLTPLTLAVISGHERVALYLLSRTSQLFVDHTFPGRRRTLLHEAARRGLASVVAMLLQLFPQTFTSAKQDAWTQRTAIHEALLVGINVVQDGQVLQNRRHQAHNAASTTFDEQADAVMAVLETLLAKVNDLSVEAKDFVGL